MNTTGQWFWHAGATLMLADIAATVRPEVTPEAWLVVAGIALMAMGLSVGFINGVWDAWEQHKASERGEPA